LAEKTSLQQGWHVFFERNHECIRVVQDRSAFYPVSGAFTPDHIVYAGSDPLFIEINTANSGTRTHVIENAWENHQDKTKNIPKIIAVQNLGIFGIGLTEKAARLAIELFTDTVKVAIYSQAFGGVCFMSRDKIDFINTWEVEQYRSKISRGA
jgi:rhamnose utilization protein RhaD (predicted bifunctional aldolase and dehydrogenase)